MKESTATALALLTFVVAVYVLALTDTPGVGWRVKAPSPAQGSSE